MSPEPLPPLRNHDEIQRAHDILWSQVMGETPFVFEESQRPCVRAALDVLCWCLGHTHADSFTRSLAKIEGALAQLGYRLAPRPGAGPPP